MPLQVAPFQALQFDQQSLTGEQPGAAGIPVARRQRWCRVAPAFEAVGLLGEPGERERVEVGLTMQPGEGLGHERVQATAGEAPVHQREHLVELRQALVVQGERAPCDVEA